MLDTIKTFVSILFFALFFLFSERVVSEQDTYIPMDFSAGRPTVNVKINGKGPYPFVFDTGAPEGVIDSELAEGLQLSIIDTVEIGDGVVIEQTERVNVKSLNLAGTLFSNVLLDKFQLKGRFYSNFVGIIGMSLFSDYLLTIDYPNQQISFRTGELDKNKPNTVEFIVDEGLFQIPIEVDSHIIPLHLDSGSSGGFTISKECADSLKFLTPPIEKGKALTVGRELRMWGAILQGVIKFADLEFVNPEIDIIEGTLYGQIGQKVLKNLSITLDQKQHLVYVQEN